MLLIRFIDLFTFSCGGQ